ncbi:hypothetical protein LG35_02110 [Alistipes inops]|uniref:Uncharacterized protein n=1 Tax=Alistipes inops TaxID=1501391 RepID=A0ABR4YL81_9BACT|nr:hypothetical protein LG35_02110 [Alistipes inops]
MITEQGYERSGDYLEEWSDKADDFDATYLFRDDHTGTTPPGEYSNGEETTSVSAVRWKYRPKRRR